ncbi:hypothetical protein SteCoe_4092 [Stentor coeruleus]|uniref:RanBP2-type domain-containing protein n=1 Tax=Stentor coeruleus TaxID=5963 RepID=A0A1R2CVK6_9CILI|nr:hypothetical protein SteCoe_4092 [Stentor coeruleus]
MDKYEGMKYIIVDGANILYNDKDFTDNFNEFKAYHEGLKKKHGPGTFLKYEQGERLIDISNEQDYENSLCTMTGQGLILKLEIRSDQYNDWRCKKCSTKNLAVNLVCSLCKRNRF